MKLCRMIAHLDLPRNQSQMFWESLIENASYIRRERMEKQNKIRMKATI